MPDQETKTDRWSLYICDECGEYGDKFLHPVDECRPWEGRHKGRWIGVEVCPVSELEAEKRNVAILQDALAQLRSISEHSEQRADAAEKALRELQYGPDTLTQDGLRIVNAALYGQKDKETRMPDTYLEEAVKAAAMALYPMAPGSSALGAPELREAGKALRAASVALEAHYREKLEARLKDTNVVAAARRAMEENGASVNIADAFEGIHAALAALRQDTETDERSSKEGEDG